MKALLYKLLTKWRNRCKPPKARKRVCCLCGQQIKRDHRWNMKIVLDEYLKTSNKKPHHWHCDNPTRGPGQLPDAEPMEMVMP
jgi:hypothetical protein